MPTKDVTRLLFVDVETTGLDPSTDQIVEVAIAIVNLKTRIVDVACQWLVKPSIPLSEFSAKNFQNEIANGWAYALTLPEVLSMLAHYMKGATLAGQNPIFDRNFLEAAFYHTGQAWPEMDYHLVDVSSMAWPLAMLGEVPGVSLRHTRLWAGCSADQSHRAAQDVDDTIRVFWKLVDTFRVGLHELSDPEVREFHAMDRETVPDTLRVTAARDSNPGPI